MDELPATHTGAPPEPPPGLGAAELEVEAADLELLVRVRGELDVLLHPVVLVGLDDGQPREVLEEDLRHLAIRVGAELLVDGEAGGVAELVELGVAPVIVRPARAEQAPHHAVRVAERGGRVAPIKALEAPLPVRLRAPGHLDDLDLDVDS